MVKLNKKMLIIIIGSIITIFAFIGYYIYSNNSDGNDDLYSENFNNTENNIKETKTKEEKLIIVHVAGAVTNPGIVNLNENSRISDAIEKAGGLTGEADISKINLAYLLEDGMKIYIPTHNEIEEEKNMENNIGDAKEYVIKNNESVNNNSNKNINQKINLNTATQNELETLPGIGTATALKIINYRKENGKFQSVEDLKNVKGIGNNKFESIKELISVK